MTDNDDRSPWAPPGGTNAGSSLPSPPPRADVLVVDAVEAAPPTASSRWLGRSVALLGAAAIVAGGGYLALNAGTSDSGAETPEAAVTELLEALSAEDLLGAAELVEPAERETLVTAGVEVADELVRLEVLAADLDLASIRGIDIDFDNLDLRTEHVGDDVANIIIEGGTYSASYDADALPFGPLVLDRVPADWLESTDIVSSTISNSQLLPITTVERDGRWYVSLWYSVAENARRGLDAPFPAANERPVPLGADSPEAAVRRLVDEAVNLDVRQIIRMLDPDEARALYDYAPLFLDDAERTTADILDDARREGVTWDVHTLELHAEGGGDRVRVVIDAVGFSLRSDETTLDVDATNDSIAVDMESVDPWDGSISTFQVESDGDCTTIVTEDQRDGRQSEEYCVDDILGGLALSVSGLVGTSSVLNSAVGIETHRVDGRWYLSPTRSITEPLLTVMREWTPEDLAGLVDAIVEFAEDPFISDSFDSGGLFTDDTFAEAEQPPSPSTTPRLLPSPSTTITLFGDEPGFGPELDAENLDLLDPSHELVFAYDLLDLSSGLESWVPGVEAPASLRSVLADVLIADSSAVVIVIDTGDPGSAAAYIDEVASLEGAVTENLGGVAVVETLDGWGDAVFVAATDASVVVVGTYGASPDEMRSVMTTQLFGG